jgi:type IV pilus assembly protein PilF
MRQPERWLLVASLLALLAGCGATTGAAGNKGSGPATANQEAAALQVQLGQGYLRQGDLEIARDRLRRALELDPHSVAAHTVMAVLQERINRPAVAETHYRRAYELKPDDGSVNNNYGTFLCGNGRFEEAQRHFDRAVADPFYRTPAVAYGNAGFCALKAGDGERAERMLRLSLEHDAKQPGTLFELARLHYARGDMMRARAFLQRYESIGEVEPQALELGARIEQRLGDSAASARYIESLQRKFPEFSPASGLNEPGLQ